MLLARHTLAASTSTILPSRVQVALELDISPIGFKRSTLRVSEWQSKFEKIATLTRVCILSFALHDFSTFPSCCSFIVAEST